MAEHCQSNSNANGGISDGNALGNEITSANTLVGNSTTVLTGYLRRVGTMTGTVYGRVYNSSGTLVHTYGSVDASTIDSDNYDPVVFSGGGAYTMASDDRVVYELDISSGSIRYDVQTSSVTGWKRVERSSGTWNPAEDNVAVKMCVTYSETPTSKTRLPPPPLIARF